jgi:hypothetical protein
MSAISVQKRLLSAIDVQFRGGRACTANILSWIFISSQDRMRERLEYIVLIDRSAFSTIRLGVDASIAQIPAMNESQEFRGMPPRTVGLTNTNTGNNDSCAHRRRVIGHQFLKYWTQITGVDTGGP